MSDLMTKSEILYKQTTERPVVNDSPVTNTQLLYIQDRSDGNYADNFVKIQSTVVNNSDLVSWSTANLVIPVVGILEPTTTADTVLAIDAKEALNLMLMKSEQSIINSIKMDINSHTVVNQTDNICISNYFDTITTLSQENKEQYKNELHYQDFKSHEWEYDVTNNLYRQTKSSYTQQLYVEDASKNTLIPDSLNNYQNILVKNGNTWIYYYTLVIPLKRLNPAFFSSVPISRNMAIDIELRLNQVKNYRVDVSSNKDATVVSHNMSTNICPFYRGQADKAKDKEGKYHYSMGVVKSQHPTKNESYSHAINRVRLYYEKINLTAENEQVLLNVEPIKMYYNDIIHDSRTTTSKHFNFIINQHMSNVEKILIVPFIANESTTNKASGTQSCFQMLSPCPTRIKNFKLMISNTQLYERTPEFTFESFSNMLSSLGSDSKLTTFTTKSITREEFENHLGYYYFDLSDMLERGSVITRSYTFEGELISNAMVEFHYFIFQRTGAQIDVSNSKTIKLPISA